MTKQKYRCNLHNIEFDSIDQLSFHIEWKHPLIMPQPDPINHPSHYSFSIKPIDAIESWNLGFHLGNTVKYIARAENKGSKLEDLKKARWYLDREIERLENS